jgi:hypothetical protein
MRRPASERAGGEGLPSRFISDVETFERVTVYALDTGSMLAVEGRGRGCVRESR